MLLLSVRFACNTVRVAGDKETRARGAHTEGPPAHPQTQRYRRCSGGNRYAFYYCAISLIEDLHCFRLRVLEQTKNKLGVHCTAGLVKCPFHSLRARNFF